LGRRWFFACLILRGGIVRAPHLLLIIVIMERLNGQYQGFFFNFKN
jgi:hypothetical protein